MRSGSVSDNLLQPATPWHFAPINFGLCFFSSTDERMSVHVHAPCLCIQNDSLYNPNADTSRVETGRKCWKSKGGRGIAVHAVGIPLEP